MSNLLSRNSPVFNRSLSGSRKKNIQRGFCATVHNTSLVFVKIIQTVKHLTFTSSHEPSGKNNETAVLTGFCHNTVYDFSVYAQITENTLTQ